MPADDESIARGAVEGEPRAGTEPDGGGDVARDVSEADASSDARPADASTDGEGDSSAASPEAATVSEAADPEAAFSRLGNATRLRVLRHLAEADAPPTFTDLFEASGEETTAGFAYHLRQLAGHYVEKRPTGDDDEADARYVLTSAGRAVARAIEAGVYTDRVERGPDEIDGDCPVCGAPALEAGLADNVVRVACTACETTLLSLPFPPNGARNREMADLLSAFDAYHRRRLSLVADGVCPDCGGVAVGRIESADAPAPRDADGDDEVGEAGEAARERPVVHAACEACSFSLRAPVSLAVVDRPEVVAFFADHDAEPGPIWNLGPTWREAVLSTDPWAVRVSVRLGEGDDAEELRLLVGDGPTVVDAERAAVE